jgi:hypothetical protein
MFFVTASITLCRYHHHSSSLSRLLVRHMQSSIAVVYIRISQNNDCSVNFSLKKVALHFLNIYTHYIYRILTMNPSSPPRPQQDTNPSQPAINLEQKTINHEVIAGLNARKKFQRRTKAHRQTLLKLQRWEKCSSWVSWRNQSVIYRAISKSK